MRILIYALPRTGSTNLAYYLGESLNYLVAVEPFHESRFWQQTLTEYDILERDNVVVKTMWGQGGYWYKDLVDKFDKVIILWRENTLQQAESFAYAALDNSQKYWHDPYIFTSKEVPEEDINNHLIWFQDRYKEVEDIHDFKTTYEKIYVTGEDLDRLDQHVGIEGKQYRFILDKNNRYRRDNLQVKKKLI
jgi:hypothetical protein